MTAPILDVQTISLAFGGLKAVSDFKLALAPGALEGLIGPNGDGKTTIFDVIAGALAPSRGRVLFEGRPLPACRPHAVAARGVARTFQLVRLFEAMTVLDNVLVGCHRAGRAGWLACSLRLPGACREERRLRDRALATLERVGLRERAATPAGALPYGEQRLVELARALATGARLLLLDEPGAGLNGEEQARLAGLIREIRASGVTVLLVDHHIDFVLGLADDVLVLAAGERLAEGPPDAVRAHPAVISAYLGEEAA